MAWRIEYDAGANKDLSRLDRQIAQRILDFLGGVWPNWKTRAASVRL
jgi:FtsZ-interacting cell division protein YlmF